MRRASLASALILTFAAGSLRAEGPKPPEPLRARPVRITSCDLPDVAAEAGRFLGLYRGIDITYLLEGKDVIGIKEGTLAIDSIRTADGKNLADKVSPCSHCQLWPGIGCAGNGKYCLFGVGVDDTSHFGKLDNLAVTGSIVAILGSKPKKETVEIGFGDEHTGANTAGPFSISLITYSPPVPPTTIAPASPPAPAKTPPPPDAAPAPRNVIRVKGPTAGIIDVTFKDGDEDLRALSYSVGGSSPSWDNTEYTLPQPKTGKISVTVRYWSDLKEAKVQIGGKT
jgi:hypothetical protein